jgi:hypothetical protein
MHAMHGGTSAFIVANLIREDGASPCVQALEALVVWHSFRGFLGGGWAINNTLFLIRQSQG